MTNTYKYRIIVIESLDEDVGDSLTGTHLFQNIITRLPSRFPFIEPSFFSIRSKEELQEVLDNINKTTTPDDIVMVHLEAHGCEDGITLSNKSTILWLELYDLIRPINLKISNRLILNLALCEGISLLGNIDIHQRAPFSIAFFFNRKILQNEVLRSMVQFYSFDETPFALMESARRANESIEGNDNNCVFGWITAEQHFDAVMNPERDSAMFKRMVANNYSTFRERGITDKPFEEFVEEVKQKMIVDGANYRSFYLCKDMQE